MKEILSDIRRWSGRGERYAIATVIATRRSAPRPVGSKFAVSKRGEMAGSVSGGCVENEVYGCAREILDGAEPRLLTFGISDDLALSVGLPCGGEIDVFVEEQDDGLAARVGEALEREEHGVLFTVIEGEGIGAQVFVPESGDPVGNAPAELAGKASEVLHGGYNRTLELEGRTVFAEVIGPPPRLLVFGAVDTAEALCRAAKSVGWRTIVADPRARFATVERLPSADEIVVAWPDQALERLKPDHATAVVVLTHEDRFDLPALAGALATEAFYVGALGSRRNQARRRELLVEAGVDEAALERIAGPAGLDIGAHSPAETALSIMAEILAVRAGRDGGPLREASGRIHAEVA